MFFISLLFMDIIRLLPDSVANQIAAGEVVQRPASVVKELMENAIDAGAKNIQVVLKNVGKAVIQVIDDGKGMSPLDARMAFERHATSKISSAQDLFRINTLGFRGEALPSIASVSEVELKTRRTEDELGTCLYIAASELKKQETISTPQGANVSVKNLFYNIPARRKFLKSDTTELRNVINEFLRVALTHPEIAFSLANNGNEIYNLPGSGIRQRIVNVFGKGINTKLINIDCETGLVTIKGFICHPQHAKKSYGEQYFFVNNRFMKHSFFHKAIMEAYSGLISADAVPSYFIYFTVNPSLIDINIHPTKTEIKFQDETDFFQILMAGVKEALGKFNVTPPLDFDTEGSIDYAPPAQASGTPYVPKVNYNPNYNPFNYQSGKISIEDSDFEQKTGGQTYTPPRTEKVPANWDILFDGLKEKEEFCQTEIPEMAEEVNPVKPTTSGYFQLKGRYIVTPVQNGLMLIDQKRAHERILFEKYCNTLASARVAGQKSLFPEMLELSASDFTLVRELNADLEFLGFELSPSGKNSFAIHATPPDLSYSHAKEVLIELIEHYKNTEGSVRNKMKERVALALAKASATGYNTILTCEEMSDMSDHLFACKHHNFTADGKTIIHILNYEDVNSWFK